MTVAAMRSLFAGQIVHTVFERGQWGYRREGSDVLHTCHNREHAVEVGRKAAKRVGSEHVVHNRQGAVVRRECFW